MLDFLSNNVTEIVTILIAIVGIGIAIYKGQKDKARQGIYALVLQAEKEIVGTEVGEKRLIWVINIVKTKYPLLKFVPDKIVIEMVEEAIKFANDYLSDGKLDGIVLEPSSVTSSDSNII